MMVTQLWFCMIFLGLSASVRADLTLSGPRCGMYTCKFQEYCSEIDNQCKSCADICDRSNHNFEEKLCITDCQDYLHDIRYVKNVGGVTPESDKNENREEDIAKLYKLVWTTLTLLIILIIALSVIPIYKLYNWVKVNDVRLKNVLRHIRKNHDERNAEDMENKSPPTNGGPRRDLRLNIASPVTHSEITTPGTLSTSLSRRPAEDSALDYAYDNHAMSGTPSPHSGKTTRESDF